MSGSQGRRKQEHSCMQISMKGMTTMNMAGVTEEDDTGMAPMRISQRAILKRRTLK